jgi:hypothetical protein
MINATPGECRQISRSCLHRNECSVESGPAPDFRAAPDMTFLPPVTVPLRASDCMSYPTFLGAPSAASDGPGKESRWLARC